MAHFGLSPKLILTNFAEHKLINYLLPCSSCHCCVFLYLD